MRDPDDLVYFRPADGDLITGGPDIDAWTMDIRRVGVHHRDPGFVLERTRESLSTYYDISYPNAHALSARGLRVSPVYELLLELDAEFGDKAGWERPEWFRSNDDHIHESARPRGLAGRHWSTAIRPNTSRPASARACSTRRPSPRSRSPVREPAGCSNGWAPTTSTPTSVA